MRTRSQTGFAALQTEGAILPADLLRRIAEGDASLGGLDSGSYHLPAGERLSEAVSRSWSRLQGSWAAFKSAKERLPETDAGTTLTRERWLLPLFQELGYGRLTPAKPITMGEKSYGISHGWQHTPLHLVSFRLDLDKRQPGAAGASRSSPHSLVQELLNRSDDHLWGIVSNGLRLRILRDNASLSRQAFVEFDLEAVFDGELYADFALLWLLCHQSRVEGDEPESCWLEKWSKAAKQLGTRALDRLRTGVEEAITALGTGLLVHPANGRLRDRLQGGNLDLLDLYRELLRHVYRLLFLFVAEDRGLLHPPSASAAGKERYSRFFSTQRLRQTAARLRGSRHGDLFASHRLVIGWLGSAAGRSEVGLPALGSFVFSQAAVPETGPCEIANREFLAAVRALAFTADAGVRRAVDYRNLGAEELGSVYESLLDLYPGVEVGAGRFELTHGGSERRATGSHYTPTPVTKTVLDFALDLAIAECLKQLDPEKALLSLRVLDPACGSGHFLIAAAQRIGRRLASIRTGDEEPAPEAIRQAVRDVVAHCIFGVDVNPMAVELCKVALWMETLEPGKPLGFLDHRIRCGDSLLGVPLATTVSRMKRELDERRAELTAEVATVEQSIRKAPFKGEEADRLSKKQKALEKELNGLEYDLWPDHVPDEAFKATSEDDKSLVRATVADNRKERRSGQRSLFRGTLLDVTAAARVTEQLATADETVADVQAKSDSLRVLEASPAYRVAKLRADAWCAAYFWRIAADEPPAPTDAVFQLLKEAPDRLDPAMSVRIDELAARHRFFHFELAFPEVFVGERPGFDVEVGNPPYLGARRSAPTSGTGTSTS
ncbi:MAG: N-6 DNA methylase [Acidobacteria bacterium]|nr:N-6 DNA methylase [Acidobacteriota bacterium]